MSDFIFKIAPNVLLGKQTITRLGSLICDKGSRFILILDPATYEAGCLDKITQSMQNSGLDFFTYDELPNNPDSVTLEEVIKLSRGGCIDGVIACGGEKALNLGRAVAALYNEKNSVYDYVNGEIPTAKALPLICIPTSIRDSFLFCDRSAVIDARSNQIRLLKLQENICDLVIFDGDFSSTLTKNQVAAVALNILCMTFETYLSKKSSFLSDALAEKIFELMSPDESLTNPIAMNDASDLGILECGCMSSMTAALSSLGPVTALAWAVHARYKTSRTLISAILLPYLIEDTLFACDKLVMAAQRFGVVDRNATATEAAAKLAEEVRSRIAKASLPARLKDLSISIEQLALAVNDAVQLEFVQYYSKPINSDTLFNLVKLAY